jgi:DNA-binding MarR family transcriptional regulator
METSPEPRWLDEAERAAWLALACVLINLLPALDAQLQRDAGISHFEYRTMSALSEQPECTMRISDLAAVTESSLARVSQVAARLEKRGWLRRAPDPADGRYTLATLTENGWTTVAEAAPGHVDTVRRLVLDPLTRTQVNQLTTIGHRIMHAIDPDPAHWPRP